MMFFAKLFLIISLVTFILGLITRFLGYGVGRGAPWAFGITPDAYLRLTNTLVIYAIAFAVMARF
jgi:hypothetical protein